MASTPTPSFTVDAVLSGAFGFSSTNVALPGTPGSDACVRIVNTGPMPMAVALGSSGATVTPSTGLVIMPGQTQYLTIGAATHIAGVSSGGPGNTAMFNLATGT